jgi:DNA polymerase-1
MPTLYIIDGYAQFFRAYHAIRTPMSSPVTKEPTNMTFGFVGMLLKLLRGEGKIKDAPDARADYVVVTIDVSGDKETFRSELYPEYKANRSAPPEDLGPQVDRALALLGAMGIPVVGSAGFEADDVIATLVTRLRKERPDLRIRIISKDKDLKQLLCDAEGNCVQLYDIHTDLLVTEASLKEEAGITPVQVIDMLALMGDNVDNVPGVEGVGPKTAAQLVAQYGTLDNLLAHAHEVKGTRGEAWRAAGDLLKLSRTLVTLRHDAPVEFELAKAEAARFDLEALLPILRELGFNRYQDEVKLLMGQPLGPMAPAKPAGGAPVPAAPAAPARTPAKAKGGDLFTGGLFDAPAGDAGAGGAPGFLTAQSGKYRCISTKQELEELVAEMRAAPIFAIDTETTSLSPLRCKLCGVSVSTKVGTGVYIPVRSPDCGAHLDEKTVLDALRPLLEDPSIHKAGHNLKYDMLVLRRHGVELRGLGAGLDGDHDAPTSFDSMVASYLIDASRSSHSLDALAMALLGRTNISIKDLIGSGKEQRTFDTVALAQATEYAAEDADVSLQLREVMLPQLRAMGLMPLFADVELPLVEVLAELEWNGILVDPAELERQRQRLQARIDELKRSIDDEAMKSAGRTFNPDSPKQLAAFLFNKATDAEPGLGLRSLKKTKTGDSTDIEVLEKLASDPQLGTPVPGLIVEHRQLQKLVGTYLVALVEEINPETKRIHSSFNQTVAVTGRLASSDPNLQNIPIRTEVGREIRRAFVAAPGHALVSADYSQIELRLLAHLSRDPALILAFHEGQDIHAAVAAQIHGVPIGEVTREQRNGAKMVNFGIVYGITAFGLARRLGIGNAEAQTIIDGYKKRFAGITTFLQECIDQAQRQGYVETMLKRRRPIPDIDSTNPARRSLAERTAINSVVQGSAADLIKLAMVDIYRVLRGAPAWGGVKMLLQIHDELVFESPVEQAEATRAMIVERMESAMKLSVPLKVDASIAGNWFEGK